MQPRLSEDEINALINSEELSDIADGDLEIDWQHEDEHPESDEEQGVNVIDEPINLFIDDDDLQVLDDDALQVLETPPTWDFLRTPPTSSAPTPSTSMDVIGTPSMASLDVIGTPSTSSAPTPSPWSTPSTSRGPIVPTSLFLTGCPTYKPRAKSRSVTPAIEDRVALFERGNIPLQERLQEEDVDDLPGEDQAMDVIQEDIPADMDAIQEDLPAAMDVPDIAAPQLRGRGRGRGRPKGRRGVGGRGRAGQPAAPGQAAVGQAASGQRGQTAHRGRGRAPRAAGLFTRAVLPTRGQSRSPLQLSPTETLSYKRARGPQRQPGAAIIRFENHLLPASPPMVPAGPPPLPDLQAPVRCFDATWHNEKLEEQANTTPRAINQRPGRPHPRVRSFITPVSLFDVFFATRNSGKDLYIHKSKDDKT